MSAWVLISLAVAFSLGLCTYWAMGEIMSGVGTEVPFWRGIVQGGWPLLLGAVSFWFAVCAAVYWICVGIGALL